MKKVTVVIIIIVLIIYSSLFAEYISEQKVTKAIINNQNILCNYESIKISEIITYNDSLNYIPKSNYDLIENLTKTDSLMSGIIKFPFFDENIWLYPFEQDSLVLASITSNNSKIDEYLQEIQYVFNSDLTEIKEFTGRIYTKLSMFEKDCEYFLYKANYSKYDDIFLPDSVSYYSHKDSLFSKPLLSARSNYDLTKSGNKDFKTNKWIKNFDCSMYPKLSDKELLKRFFEDKVFEEKVCYLSGELLSWQKNFEHIGASIDSTVNVNYRILEQDDKSRVWKVSLSNNDGAGNDFYVKLINDTIMVKIDRIRSFVLPGFYYIMADSILANPKSSNEEEYLAKSIKLQSSTDDNLMNHFIQNKRKFKRLLKLFSSDKDSQIIHFNPYNTDESLDPKYTKNSKDLYLSTMSKKIDSSIIHFSLGGHLDNDVGFMYCKKVSDLPSILNTNYILVEKICNNWYLYKTT